MYYATFLHNSQDLMTFKENVYVRILLGLYEFGLMTNILSNSLIISDFLSIFSGYRILFSIVSPHLSVNL